MQAVNEVGSRGRVQYVFPKQAKCIIYLICSVDKDPNFSSANYLYSYKKWDGYGCRHCFCLDESVGPYRVVKYPSLSEVLVPVCKMIRFPQDFSP